MSELDIVKDLAKQALTISTPTGSSDNSLWDRAQRLVRNAEYICRLPELAKTSLQIDHFCLIAAAYFSDSGLARHLEAKEQGAKLALSGANGDELLDFSTQVVEEKLAGAVKKARIEKINRIITESGSLLTRMIEAMILSDARNLDDMGAAGIFNEFRRYVIGGKGACDAVRSWKRKIDYRYWQARLKESFRFEQVRELAEQRLSAAEHFMNQLKAETEALDLEELITESQEGK
jgi:HD superfamily phosphodiesterase